MSIKEKYIRNTTVIILIIVTFLYVLHTRQFSIKTSAIQDLTFPSTINVVNHTQIEELEYLTNLILDKHFGYDSISIEYYYMPEEFESPPISPIILKGFVIKNYVKKNAYVIFVSKNLKHIEVPSFLCHELYHVYQYESKRLVSLDFFSLHVIYDGVEICAHDTPYFKRQYEIDAFKNEEVVFKSIMKYLY